MREHAVQALHDRVGAAQVVGHAVPAQAREQERETVAVAVVAPAHRGVVVGERGRVGVAMRRDLDEHAVEQQLGADVGDRASWSARAAAMREAVVELAHERDRRRQPVERRVGRVMDLDPARDRGVRGLGEPPAAHRREVRQHGPEQRAGLTRGGACDGRVPEEVHVPC